MVSTLKVAWSHADENEPKYTVIPLHGLPHPIVYLNVEGQVSILRLARLGRVPDFERNQVVEGDCQPPSLEVVQRALSELVKSTCEANNMRSPR